LSVISNREGNEFTIRRPIIPLRASDEPVDEVISIVHVLVSSRLEPEEIEAICALVRARLKERSRMHERIEGMR
jgi:hypothetical protein